MKGRMTISDVKQRKLELTDEGKRGVRTQFGALCWRKRADEVQVLLVTSRRRRRWIIPKGWPQDRTTPAKAALADSRILVVDADVAVLTAIADLPDADDADPDGR